MTGERKSNPIVKASPWAAVLAATLGAVMRFLPASVENVLTMIFAVALVSCMAAVVSIAMWYRHTQKQKSASPEAKS